jgi:hypothetical protein
MLKDIIAIVATVLIVKCVGVARRRHRLML